MCIRDSVSPEAAAGGPIAFIEEGDLVSYSVENRTINLTGIHGVPCSVEEGTKVLAERAKAGKMCIRDSA